MAGTAGGNGATAGAAATGAIFCAVGAGFCPDGFVAGCVDVCELFSWGTGGVGGWFVGGVRGKIGRAVPQRGGGATGAVDVLLSCAWLKRPAPQSRQANRAIRKMATGTAFGIALGLLIFASVSMTQRATGMKAT